MDTAIYARVSTSDQNCELQLRELRDYCRRQGWRIAGEYVDTGWSGAKASRPQLDRMMADARAKKIECVLVWKLDRLGRSVLNLTQAIQDLDRWGVRFIATNQGIDTDRRNPAATLLLHILSAVAEFERQLTRERVAAGMKAFQAAHAAGHVGTQRRTHSGKNLAIGRPKRVFDRGRLAELRAGGQSIRQIARTLDVGLATVVRELRALEPSS